MKNNRNSHLFIAAAFALVVLFQNCGPARLQGSADTNSSLDDGNTVGSKVDVPSLLRAPQEPGSNVLFPAAALQNDFDYAPGAPVLENLVLRKNDFTRIEWIHGPTSTVISNGDRLSPRAYTAAMQGIYYIVGYRDQSPFLLSQFNLVNKTSAALAVNAAGAVQFSQNLVESDATTESYLVQAEAPAVDLSSVQVTLKNSGAVIGGKRSVLVSKKLSESLDVEFQFKDATGQSLTKTLTLPAVTPFPAPTTQTEVWMLGQPTITAGPGATFSLVLQFNGMPMSTSYNIFCHFIQTNGLNRSDMTIDYIPTVSTTNWNGRMRFTLFQTVPKDLPPGQYAIRVGLFNAVDRLPLGMGPGVTADTTLRYTVGTFVRP
jgi:hypothetical protein